MKRCNILLLILVVFAILLLGNDRGAEEQDILSMMKIQVQEWNRGNFEGFMAPYWQSDRMTFQSGNTRRYGWNTLLKMYKTNYAGDKRGILNFSDIEVKFLADDLAYVLGRWQVTTGTVDKSEKKEGLFTLILRKFPQGWIIIHDHSS
jgi:beta-aspartyl-peptidase (threonine type)